jgi:hypothetical protein
VSVCTVTAEFSRHKYTFVQRVVDVRMLVRACSAIQHLCMANGVDTTDQTEVSLLCRLSEFQTLPDVSKSP